MFQNKCPTVDVLEAATRAGRISRRIELHLARCAKCAAVVSQIKDSAGFETLIRTTGADDLDHETRLRISGICRKATRRIAPPPR